MMSTSNTSKTVASGGKNEKESSFRFNPNAKPFHPLENRSECQTQENTNYIASFANNTPLQPGPSQFQGIQYQPMIQNQMSYGWPQLPLPVSQPQMVNAPGFQAAAVMSQFALHPAMCPWSPGMAPYNGLAPYQQHLANQQHMESHGPSTDMPSQLMFEGLPNPQKNLLVCDRSESAPTTSAVDNWHSSTRGLQSSGQDRQENEPHMTGTTSTATQVDPAEVSNRSPEHFQKMKSEIELLRRQFSAVELWAQTNNIDLGSVLAEHIVDVSNKPKKEFILSSAVKQDNISEKKNLEQPKILEAKKDTSTLSSEIAHEVVRQQDKGEENTSKHVEVHSATGPIIASDSARDGYQETSPLQESSTPIAATKELEQVATEQKENAPPPEKKPQDFSGWVDVKKIHKKWRAESIPLKQETPQTKSPIIKEKKVKTKKGSKPETSTSMESDYSSRTFVPNVHPSNVELADGSPKSREKSPERGTTSENPSMPGPSEVEKVIQESSEVKKEKEFKAQLRTQNIDEQCDNIEKWLFAKAKKELLDVKGAPMNEEVLDEKGLKVLVSVYIDMILEYSQIMYLNRASYLAFDRKRERVNPFQEIMITYWRHNPLYAPKSKRASANIDTIVRGRLEHYKNLGTEDSQTMYCFLAILMMLDRECLTEDLLFLYGSPKSEALLSEHETKYFHMVFTFTDWNPSEFRPKPAYKEDLKRLPVKLDTREMNNFLHLLDNQCYRRIHQSKGAEEMDKVQSLVYKAYMDSREKEIDWSPEKTTKFLRSRLLKLKNLKEPSEENVQYKKYYKFLTHVSSSIVDFDVYWFKQCLDRKNTEEWHCLKSDADFFSYLFTTPR